MPEQSKTEQANKPKKIEFEQKGKQGPHQFDSHIVVPSAKDPHPTGAVLSSHGVRTLPNGGKGLVNPQPELKK